MNLTVINLKTYSEGTAKKAERIIRLCENISKKIIVCVQPSEFWIAKRAKIPLYAQHLDNITLGAHTGFLLPEAAKKYGIKGTLLNHSEHKMPLKELAAAIMKCKKLGLKVIACADNPQEAGKIAKLKPDYIAIEPPELIGGNISVSKAKPEVITNALKKVGKIPLLCGAGIKSREDVVKALELGAEGILVASGVVKAKDVKKAIIDLTV